jgi:hypothetical protein
MKLIVILCLFSLSLLAQDEESEALKAMRLSCEKQKVALGCFNHANMLARLDKNEEADKAFELGCKLGDSPSCKKEKWDLPSPVTAKLPTESPIETEETVSSADETITPPSSEEPISPPEAESSVPESSVPESLVPESSVPDSSDMSLDTGDMINQ